MEGNVTQAALLQSLLNSLNADPALRSNGELYINSTEALPGVPVSLAQFALSHSLPLPVRQLAAVVLKRCVKYHWYSEANNFSPPEICENDKISLRQMLPQGLADPERKIRTAVSMVIANIAASDWPEDWPELLGGLVSLFRGSNPLEVQGAIKCLSLLAAEFSTDQLPQLIPGLFPELLRVLSANPPYPPRVCTRALTVILNCLEILEVGVEEDPSLLTLLDTFLPPLLSFFASALAPVSLTSNRDFGVQMEVLKVLKVLVKGFPKLLKKLLDPVLTAAWSWLLSALPQYEALEVYGEGFDGDEEDSDGERLGAEMLICHLLEFVNALIDVPRHAQKMKPYLQVLAYACIAYMQITASQAESWAADPSMFVAQDDEDSFEDSVRISARNLLHDVVEVFHVEGLSAVASAAFRRVEEAASSPTRWQMREAVLLTMSTVAVDFTAAAQAAKEAGLPPTLDLDGLLKHVLIPDILPDRPPFLRGRALVCASDFVSSLGPERSLPFLQAVVHALQPSEPLTVRICACRALSQFVPHLEEKIARECLSASLPLVCDMAHSASEDCLALAMETLSVIVKKDASVAAQYESIITPLVFNVWSQYHNDPLMTLDAVSVLEAMSNHPAVLSLMQSRLVPPILSILSSRSSPETLIQSAIDVLASLIKPIQGQLPPSILDSALPVLFQMILSSDDPSILQNGSECLKQFVKAAPQQLLSWQHGEWTALQLLVQVVGKLLNTALSDSAALFVGPLICQLIIRLGAHLGSSLPLILQAVVLRTHSAKSVPLVNSLVIVFARLAADLPLQTLDFLNAVHLPDGSPSLPFIMSTWMDAHDTFHNLYHTSISNLALAKLWGLRDRRLNSINVKGELVVTKQRGVKTRSKAKQNPDKYQLVPLPVKILSILVRFLQEEMSQEKEADQDEEEIEEGGEEVERQEQAQPRRQGKSPFAPAEDYQYLSEMLDMVGGEDDDDDEDLKDLKDDPVASIDIKSAIMEVIRSVLAAERTYLEQLAALLSPDDLQILRSLFAAGTS